MTRTTCPAGIWTAIPSTGGSMLLRASGRGLWVCTDGSNPADPGSTYPLGAGEGMVIAAGVPVSVFPAGSRQAKAVSEIV